ncbi:MAG: NUDIX hydrolase [Bdellovibrionaceae bacterium]|nr:NUDIX hydrolase [Bdellovibrionales bacterium]MCB9255357.1 NUDIX hydrolase [Pseudobdellovibrionaceae bacterium]
MNAQQDLISKLNECHEFWKNIGGEAEDAEESLLRFSDFVSAHSDCFQRSLLEGHVTGSALVVDAECKQVLLTHHRKLDKWLQLGGHADGDSRVEQVALKEAEEESGLKDLRFHPSLKDRPLDWDIHEIPARPGEPTHYHYDVRYLIQTTDPSAIQCSDESHALRWFPLEEVANYTTEPSLLRLIEKVRLLRAS